MIFISWFSKSVNLFLFCKSVCMFFFFLLFNWWKITMLCWFCRTTMSISCNYVGFSGASPGEESTCTAGDPHSISGSERPPGEGHGYPVSLPENSMDRDTWQSVGSQRVECDWVTNTSLSSLLPIPPLWVITEHQAGLPVSFSSFSTSSSLHTRQSTRPRYFLRLSQPLLPVLCPQVHSLHFGLHSFLANRFIGIIFLDSIYMH